MWNVLLAAALLAFAGAARSAADPAQPQVPHMQFVPPAAGTYQLQRIQRVPDALLLDGQARARPLRDLTRGKVTLLTFFYTYCTDPWGCPFAYALMTGLRERLLVQPGTAGRVRFVSISFDPTFDTPETLRLHAGALPADTRLPWEFLTARSMAELVPLLADFGQDVRVEQDKQGRPLRTINHMLKLFLIDRAGVVREIYALDYLHPDMMVNDINTLLLEEKPSTRRQGPR
ncbi:MAG TPA: SCO family protein [Burkholderiaceae bacterium]|nr:SCO family protein [Burkholderiaceae bacterium]